MPKLFKGTVNIDIRGSVPDWEPYEQPKGQTQSRHVLLELPAAIAGQQDLEAGCCS